MRIHYLQHVPYEGPAALSEWMAEREHSAVGVNLYRGDPLPPLQDVEWLIVMGGPMSVYDEASYSWLGPEREFIGAAIAAGRRVLGICLGAQLIAAALGAPVATGACREIGWYPITVTPAGRATALFDGLPDTFEAFHWHSDTFAVPAGAVHAAASRDCPHQALLYGPRVMGLQFHLEATPEWAAQLIERCGEPGSAYAAAMLERPQRFAAMRPLLWRLLDNLRAS